MSQKKAMWLGFGDLYGKVKYSLLSIFYSAANFILPPISATDRPKNCSKGNADICYTNVK